MADKQETGRIGERTAARELRARGYRIVTRNFRTREGEVDIIAMDGNTVVFVEVKTRLGSAFGIPEESITPTKQAHLVKAAQAYLQNEGLSHADWRIDIVVVKPGSATVHVNAVESPEP